MSALHYVIGFIVLTALLYFPLHQMLDGEGYTDAFLAVVLSNLVVFLWTRIGTWNVGDPITADVVFFLVVAAVYGVLLLLGWAGLTYRRTQEV